MNKYIKYILLFVILGLCFFVGCDQEPEEQKPVEEPCQHEECEWKWEEEAKCNKNNTMYYNDDLKVYGYGIRLDNTYNGEDIDLRELFKNSEAGKYNEQSILDKKKKTCGTVTDWSLF